MKFEMINENVFKELALEILRNKIVSKIYLKFFIIK